MAFLMETDESVSGIFAVFSPRLKSWVGNALVEYLTPVIFNDTRDI